MIQRIQTVYLLVAMIAMILTIFMPFAYLVNESINDVIEVTTFSATNIKGETVEYMWPSFVLIIINILFTIVGIFAYKKRIAQARLMTMNLFIFVGTCILTAIMTNMLIPEGYNCSFSFVAILPVFVIILKVLAIKSIYADEVLVRSYDRLRG